jgi:pimeloyl-ACP methyl ester carboxylesterase
MKRQEKVVNIGNVEIFTENFGNPDDPQIILIMGATASMIWWEVEFCFKLAAKGFFVIRYDNRDVGKSTTYSPGALEYSVMDMADDILKIMDSYNIEKANLVGMSLGGMLAQIVAIQNPERVNTITLISSGIWDNIPDLPQIDNKVLEYHGPNLDWNNKTEVINYMTGGWKILNGSKHPFDEHRFLKLSEIEYDRATNLISMFNHSLLKGGEELYGRSNQINVPTLIIHGDEDIVLPFEHALELKKTIPNSELIKLEGGGHLLHHLDWEILINAIASHAL